jgi:hypothetical protein
LRRLWILLLFLGAARGLAAQEGEAVSPIEWSFTGELTLRPGLDYGPPGVYDRLNTSFHYRYNFLHLVADLSLANDERYKPDEPYMLGRSFSLEGGGLELDFDFLSLRAGRFVHRDILDTPYSLFISSADLPALIADLTIHGGPFTYESRWIRLTTRSAADYPDRGASYKVFALELGALRFGLQDAAVYAGRAFDEEYFLSPVPHIVTQMVTKQDETPWQEQSNDNSIMGLFADWRGAGRSFYAQWLVDDISLDFLIPWFLRDRFGDRRIASKLAWSIGGRWELPFGRLGFHHAGATKYTFAATYDEHPYGYTYIPATEYERGGEMLALDYRDNYLGYLYGENNLAFRLELDRPLWGADLGAGLEYVISGSKSPANPWHGEEDPNRTRMLDDPVLEHTAAVELSAACPWRNWTFHSSLRLGGVFNRLALERAADGGPKVFRPQPGEHAFLYAWTVGATYLWEVGRRR